MNKDKIKQLISRLDELENSLPKEETLSLVEQIIGDKYKDVTSKVKEDSSLQVLDTINSKLDKFKEDFDLKPVLAAIEEIRTTVDQMHDSVTSEFEDTSKASELTKTELTNLIKYTKDDLQGMTGKEIANLLQKITLLEDQLSFQDNSSKQQGQTLKTIVADFESRIGSISSQLKDSEAARSTMLDNVTPRIENNSQAIENTTTELEKLRRDFLSRLSNLGGGNMNRNIAIGGNTSVLSRYTDINIKAGTNVTLSYANNNTTKYLDLTITAVGGGGGAGITRSINSIAINTAAGSASTTDYVYLVSGTTTLTLPDATGNTNLYTVKNVGTGTVTVNTTSSQTIDGSLTITLPVRYTAVDIESDGTNWNVT